MADYYIFLKKKGLKKSTAGRSTQTPTHPNTALDREAREPCRSPEGEREEQQKGREEEEEE